MTRESRPVRRFGRKLLVAAVSAAVVLSGVALAQPAAAADEGVVSVTPITEVSAFGQRVTAVAVEYSGTVDPASAVAANFKVEDSSYNFRFDNISALTNLVDRQITGAYTNSVANLREDGTSVPGSFVILELSDASPGGWTVRTSTNTSYVRINPAQPTRVFQLADVNGTDGTRLSAAASDVPKTLTRPAVNLEVDEFVRASFTATTPAGTVPYDYRLPEGYDPEEEYPLVVILPGNGMGYDGVNDRVEIVADIPATAWFQEEWTGTDEKVIVLAIQSPRIGVANEASQARELIEHFSANFAVDKDRVYLSTVSWGSRLAWNIIANRPDLIAGALITGGFASSAAERTAMAAAEVPIWITHGTGDHLLNINGIRNAHTAFRAAYAARGLSDAEINRLLKFTEYGDSSFEYLDRHLAAAPTYEDETILQWLLAQNKATDLTPRPDITTSITSRCIAGKAILNVTATSATGVPVDVAFTSTYGVKSFADVATGKNAFHAYSTRQVNLPSGSVTISATGELLGADATTTVSVPYAALSCG